MQASAQWFEELREQLIGEYQHSIYFPHAGHGTPNYTQIDTDVDISIEGNCTWKIVDNFLQDIYGDIDTGCISRVKKFKFDTE